MSWRSNRTALLALCVTLAVMLGLAVMPRTRGNVLRVARAGAQRLDSTEAPHDALEQTVDAPQAPLGVARIDDASADSRIVAAAVTTPAFDPPVLADAGRVVVTAGTAPALRSHRPAQGRAPPVL
jgi:hypothetical protein